MAVLNHDGRLSPATSEQIDRSKKVTIYFEGRPIQAYAGDTVASALYASGRRVFSRSFKYHRPRGLLCVSGRCPNCLMNVDGAPNVRSCTEPVREGMEVRRQNSWPSLDRDVLSILNSMSRFLPVGFYYKRFIRPGFSWPLARRVIRRITGIGQLDPNHRPEGESDQRHIHADVLVIGGGPAGLSAALEARKLGASVLLVDDQPVLGGHLRFRSRVSDAPNEYSALRGFEMAKKLSAEVERNGGIEVLRNTTVFGYYEGNLLTAVQGSRLIKIRAHSVVVATGCRERTLAFRNNDLPGIFLAGGLRRLIRIYGVRPGERCLVVSGNDQGLEVAAELLEAGVELAEIVDSRPEALLNSALVEELRARGVPVLHSSTIAGAMGKKRVVAATLVGMDEEGDPVSGSEREVPCDIICLSVGFSPEDALLYQSGSEPGYDPHMGEAIPKTIPSGVFAAGDVTGMHSLATNLLQGRVAGLGAALSLLDSESREEARRAAELHEGYLLDLKTLEEDYRKKLRIRPMLSVPHEDGKRFVCICEDVTEKDIFRAIEEGFDNIETLKRYSTATMGPCQGKMCHAAVAGLCARATKREIGEVGVTTSRPPLQPVTIGTLAAGSHHPIKLTPLHYRHVEAGARMMDMGEWKRPHAYTSPEEEYGAVRERVGMIDVSTLGKIDVKGGDAARLLDLVYTQSLSSLKVGRVRYSVICDESGAILDDGTITRLAEEHFFITTTTGNIEFVEGWFRWWVEALNLSVAITNVTAAYAAVNVAGPRAREALSQLTELNLSSSNAPYMSCLQGRVAGVPALLLRIGFVGETGWEIHFPAEYGEYLWDRLMEAGREYGISPFGVEAQRILRLDKRHIIVGQDTDAQSTPWESAMDWVMKFEKEDFVGRQSLLRVREKGPTRKQVGFVVEEGRTVEDGSAIVLNGRPIGFVTSARFSPQAGRFVGLALVPAELVRKAGELSIHHHGAFVKARITDEPFYDPKGERLRA